MKFLSAQERRYFDEFWTWTTKGRYYSDETKALAHQILFDSYYGNKSELNCNSSCYECDMYRKDRCMGMIGRYSYRESQAEGNKEISAGDYNYYLKTNRRIQNLFNELCLTLGTYRVKKFQEHIYNKAIESVKLHNKLNPKHKKDELKEVDPVYFSSEDLMAMDTWLKFKNEKYEGDFLCSLLSDL